MKRLLFCAGILVAFAGVSSAAAGGSGTAPYTVTDLRPLVAALGVPANFVNPTAISPGGRVAGTWDDESFCHTTQSFLFTPTAPNSPTGTMRDIGNFGASAFKATGVNDAGQVTVASENDLQCSAVARFPFIWQGGGLTQLPAGSGAANAINALGQVAGNADGAAARWTNGILLQFDNGGNAYAINDLGHVVGNSNDLAGATPFGDAFLWDGTMHDLGRLFDESTAFAVNDEDVVAGESSQVNHFSHAFVYSAGGMHDIDCDTRGRVAFGCSGPGTGGSRADGINNAGQVVGEENGRAFLWDSADGMVDLNTLLPAGSSDVLTNAVAINDSGQIIVTGASSSYLLTPPPVTIPPAPELTAPADGALLNSSGVTVTGTGVPGATVHILVDGADIGSTSVGADGGISFFFRHSDGMHHLVATQGIDGVVSPPSDAITFTIDTLSPLVTCVIADGAWHPDNVSIACTAADIGSGLANSADATFSLATSVADGDETADAATETRQVCDLAGNCATAGPIGGNMIDRKAPVVACGSADGLWHNANVTIVCTASDGGSGVSPASFGLSTNVPVNSADSNASTNSVSVCDAVGNCSTAGPIAGNQVDLAAPVLQLPANVTTTNPVVTYTATATDDDDPSPTVSCTPASGSTFAVGTTTVHCTATDHANNITMGSFAVTVAGSTKTPLERLTDAANAIGNANLKAHVRNLAQVGGNGYCSQLKVIASELGAISPQTATTADALDAVTSLQRAARCSR
jgi:probable HAF family extracellular repeat protein